MTDLENLRRTYASAPLREADALKDPIAQCQGWLDDAIKAGVSEANAMTLSTLGEDGTPRGRIVLCRGLSTGGFLFYTNYDSHKGQELARNPRASLCFLWSELARQIRIEGQTRQLQANESDAYFAKRPRGHQIGAWVSEQSSVIASREVLAERTREFESRFAGKEVPRPSHWGGYLLLPDRIEFWQGQPDRLHDRLLYTLEASVWRRVRLAP